MFLKFFTFQPNSRCEKQVILTTNKINWQVLKVDYPCWLLYYVILSILCCKLFVWHCFISRNMTGRPPPRPTGPPGNPRPVMVSGQVQARGALPARPLRPPPPPIGALRQMMGRGPGPVTRPPLCPPGVRVPPPRPPIGRPTAPATRPMPPTLPVARHVGQMVPSTSASAVPPSIQKPTSPPTFATGPLQQSLPSVQSKILIFYSGN